MENLHDQGLKAFERKNYDFAKVFFLQAIKAQPEFIESYFYLGKCHFLENEGQLAIHYLKKFIILGKGDAAAVPNIAYAYDMLAQSHQHNDSHIALKYYNLATLLFPECGSAWCNMGHLNIALAHKASDLDKELSNDYLKSAKESFNRCLEISNDNPHFLHGLAVWYDESLELMLQDPSSEPTPKIVEDYFNSATTYYRKAAAACNKEDLAFKEILVINLSECLTQYGHFFYKNKDYEKAEKIYLQAIHAYPKHTRAMNQVGLSLAKRKHFEEARKYFESIFEHAQQKSEVADAWLNIAYTYRLEKVWSEAKKALAEAKKLNPEDSDIDKEWAALEMAMNKESVTDRFIYENLCNESIH